VSDAGAAGDRNAARRAAVGPAVQRTPRTLVMCAVAAIALIAADQASKAWAASALGGGEGIVLAEGMLELVHAENPGGAFSILGDMPQAVRVAGFAAVAIGFSIVLCVALWRGRGGPLFTWGAPLVVAGALGNMIDRVGHGTVTDFVHAHWEGVFDYPVFNLADVWIFVGVALLVIDSFRTPARAPEREAAAAG
jgi:signal peptidase II